MAINSVGSSNYKQSFQSTPLKVIQSLGWVVLAILALPTIVGSCFAWKKLVAIWDESERPDTKTTSLVASNVLGKTIESLLEKWEKEAPGEEGRKVAKKRILDFLASQQTASPQTTIDLSDLNFSSLPDEDVFNDDRFSELKELNLIGNPLRCHMLMLRNLTAAIRFNELPWEPANQRVLESFDDLLNEVGVCAQTPLQVKKDLYKQAIFQFRKTSNCLGSCSAEAYLDYLKSTEQSLDFHTQLLYKTVPSFDFFLNTMKAATEKDASLIFVPFLLAKSLVHEQHIVVAVINVTEQRIEYFDPKGNRLYSVFGSLVDRNLAEYNISTQEFLKKLSLFVFSDKKEPSIIRNINGPQPLSNRVDCGAYVLDFIQTRMHKDFPKADNPNYFTTSLSSNGEQLRRQLADTLESSLD